MEWRTYAEFPRYSVSDAGVVKNSETGRVLKPQIEKNGYLRVLLYPEKKHRSVHRMVALTFIPNANNKPHINHIDGNKQNNAVSNLEWCTQQENCRHAIDVLGRHTSIETMRKNAERNREFHKKKVLCVETQKVYESIATAERELGLCHSSINNAVRGRSKTAGGFHWRYA